MKYHSLGKSCSEHMNSVESFGEGIQRERLSNIDIGLIEARSPERGGSFRGWRVT